MKQKKILTGIIIVCVIVLAGLTAAVLASVRYMGSYGYHLELAQKYVEKAKYGPARAEFKKAIAMEPEEKEAYIGLADLLIEMDAYEEAVQILDEGYDRTRKSVFLKKLERLTGTAGSSEGKEETRHDGDTAKAVVEDSAEQALFSYLEQELIPVYREFDWNGSYKAGYTQFSAEYLAGVDGIVHTDIRDYDGDGQPELFVLLIKDSAIIQQMYEAADGNVMLSGETGSSCGKIGGADLLEDRFYRKYGDGGAVYLAENGHSTVCLVADGTDEYIRVLRYTGSGFEETAVQEFAGSDFSGMEPEIARTAEELRACGFRASADALTDTLELQSEDAMELIFMFQGVNEKVYDPGDAYSDFYSTGDESVLGEAVFDFYPSEEAYRDAYRISRHTVQKDDFSVSDGKHTVVAYFERAVFEGNGARRIGWLNEKVEKLEEQYREQTANLNGELKNLAEFAYQDTEWYYEPHDLESVYYDGNGSVSVGYGWHWYMGGVNNTGWETLNYQLADMRKLTIYEALGVDWTKGEEMIAAALAEYGCDSSMIDAAREIGYNGYTFYFDKDSVYLCFDSYELGQGPGGILIKLPR